MGFDIGGIVGGVVGTAFGGPLGGALGAKAGDALEGLFGGNKNPSVGDMTGLLGGGGIGGLGSLGNGIMPGIAEKALSLFGQAKTPEQQSKLLDVAIKALGGEPGQPPSSMDALNNPAMLNNPGTPDPSADTDAGATDPTADSQPTTSAAPYSPPPASSDLAPSGSTSSNPSSGLSVNGNTVDTGRYTITASGDKEGDVKIFDKQSNSYVEAYGDPHVVTSDGDKADFQKNGLSIKLPDGTNVNMKPTAENGDGKSYLQGVMVEKGGQAVTMDGMHDGHVQTSAVQSDSTALRSKYLTQGQTVLSADSKDVGHLFMTDATGRRTTALDSKTQETHLDGSGGSLTRHWGGGTEAAPTGSKFAYNPQVMEKMGQVMSLAGANVRDPAAQQDIVGQLQKMLEAMTQQDAA